MENEQTKFLLLAEEVTVDEKRSNDIFLLITFKLCDNQGNQNREGVTAAFISEIINNADKYAALPLYVDVPLLLAKDYQHLTHLYDPETGKFNTTQIGGMVNFRTEMNNQGVVSQYGEARIPKREADICERIQELYELGGLNVSFEIKYNPNNVIIKDGVKFVDSGEGNSLTGMAIVSVPACPDANAMEMVAEAIEQPEANEVNKEMPNEEVVVAAEEQQEAVAETKEEKIDNEPEAEEKEEQVNAEVVHEHMSVEEGYTTTPEGETFHEIHEEHTVVETVEPQQPVIAEENQPDERDQVIAQLKARIAELEVAEAELQQIKEAQALAELKAKQEKAKAFASQQGLNVEDEAVANAIAGLDYEKIADLAMAISKEQTVTTETTIASYVDIEVSKEYGGLLERT